MSARPVPPRQRRIRGAPAIRMVKDPRGRPVLELPAETEAGVGDLFLQGWEDARLGRIPSPAGEELAAALPAMQNALEERLGVRAVQVAVGPCPGRWGLCRPGEGVIILNEELKACPLPCAEAVLAHELAHLRCPAHSPAFWGLLTAAEPDWPYREGIMRFLKHDHRV